MGRTEVPFGRLAAMLALLSLLSATVEGSLLGKSLYKRTKEAIDSQDYSAFGKTLHSSRRVPIATYKYEDDTISTARDASSAPVTSLLDRLLKGVSGRSSVKAEESARSTETSPFLSWLSGNGLGSLTGNEATYPVQESAQTIDNVSSTGSLLSLIRKVLDVMRKPETATSASGSGDVYSVSIGDTTESRIGEIIKQLLGSKSSEAEIVVATTGGTQSGSSSDRTVSELISAIRRLLRDPQSSETDEDGTAVDDDDSRRPLDIAALIRALARSGERPLAPLQSSDSAVTTVSDIPAPMSTRAAIRALIRWISKLNRLQTSKHSPGRFSSIIMNLLSRMASRSSSRSSSSSNDVINTLLSSLNRPGVSVSTSSSLPTSLASLLADLYTPRSSSTTSYASSSPLSTWLKDFENSRSSTKSLSSDSLSDLLDALDVSGGSQSALVTSSSSPVIEWLETISTTSTGGGSPRETTVSGSVSLDELLSELQDSLGFD